MPSCIVDGCISNKTKQNNFEGTILHVFPPNLERIKTWLRQTGQDFGDLEAFADKILAAKKHDAYRLCSAHFAPQCYMANTLKKVLKRDALPTIFDKNSDCGQRKYRRGIYRTKNASTQTRSGLDTQNMKSPLWKERSHVVTDPHRIDKIRGKFIERVLDLAMEIICLLTKEDNAVGKKTSGDPVIPKADPQMSEGCSTTQNPDMETSPPSLTPESNYKKILEVTNKINELLMGEVPLALQDVIVYFSLEESQYIEGPEDVITEDPHNQGDGSVFEVEVEVNFEEEESSVKSDETCMDLNNTDPEDAKNTQRDIKVKKEKEVHRRIKEEEVPKEISADPKDIRATERGIKVEEVEEGHVLIKKGEISSEISPDPKDIGDTERGIQVKELEEGHVRIKKEEISSEISPDPGDVKDKEEGKVRQIKTEEDDVPLEISTDPEGTRDTQRGVKVEEAHVWIKKEEISSEISPDPEGIRDTQRGIKVEEMEEGHVWIKKEEISSEISPDPKDVRDSQRGIKVEEVEEGHVRIKKEEIPAEIGTGENHNNVTMNSISPDDSETDDAITDNSSDEDPGTSKSNSAPHTPDLSHNLPKRKRRDSDHSNPISQHASSEEDTEALCSKNGRAPHVCSLCDESFFNKSALLRHETAHKTEKQYHCRECGKNYLNKSRFISHRRTHTGEKTHLCSLCGKSFTRKHSMIRHLRTHTAEK